jgi:hypothetical protein
MDNYLTVKIRTDGFNLEDLSQEMEESITDGYIELHNMFSNSINPNVEKINTIWENYEYILELAKYSGDYIPVYEVKASMELNYENPTYNDWLDKWFNEYATVCNDYADMNDIPVHLEVIREETEGFPVVIGKVRGHDNWKLFVEVEN